jgi:transketolase
VIDYNKLQSLDTIAHTLGLEPLRGKLESFGCHVIEVDGHNHESLKKAFLEKSQKPKVIIAHTIKGKGVSFMENKVEWHYKNPDDSQLQSALSELDGLNA